MKSLMLKSSLLIILVLVSSIIISITSDEGFGVQAVTDLLFMIGLAMLLIGAALHVVQTGFFDGIVYSFKRYFKSSTKHQMIEEDKSELSYQLNYDNPITYPVLISGAFWTILTIIISIVIVST
ncbi:DUF3899 domain-containing protein [Pseudalkalibacillus hwajinpoensis]|uniref:DUF3899 domain-containing protein n=1 Tax=Guptibacillus hwajinpoensis TaxID=208199 RepID=A0A4U1MKB2_9BACL|nr:DUF3899 domain-containing protein [Pseudalkalibacillus hwajinpoensis]TKD71899.1 DUF3899 domain-containing protein [Pseudalkalibacillus hwajinpoensis]